MKILIANYRYFISSGPERYLFNIADRLSKCGNTVMPFSINYRKNVASPYSQYFVDPIGGPEAVYFDEHPKSVDAVAKGLARTFYSYEVRRAVERMVDETRPDIAYVLYYLRKLSPSLLVGLKSRRIPIVVRISDYGMFCPEHHLLRNETPCTLCQTGSILNSVRHRCVKGSYAVSLVDATATLFHRWRGYFDLIDQFVTTNEFMSEMMVKAGFPATRLTCIPTFANLETFAPLSEARSSEPYLVYVGRLDRPKGVHVLIDGMIELARKTGSVPRLKLAGSGHDPAYVAELKQRASAAGLEDKVEFLGNVPGEAIPSLLQNAIASVMPAIWYENLPNSVVESLACGVPVIASNIGSLSATVTDGKDGLFFTPGDAVDLAAKIEILRSDNKLREKLAIGARETALSKHAPDDHTKKLLELFSRAAGQGQTKLGRQLMHSG